MNRLVIAEKPLWARQSQPFSVLMGARTAVFSETDTSLQRLNICLIHHTAEAGRVQVEILPVLGDRVTDSISSRVESPAQLLKQSAALLIKRGLVSLA